MPMTSDIADANLVQRVEQLLDGGMLSEVNKRVLSREFKVPLSKVESVATFYSQTGKFDRICVGLPCSLKSQVPPGNHRRGAEMKESSCLGYCDHAPVVMIKGRYFTRKRSRISEIDESTLGYVSSRRTGIDRYISGGGYSTLEDLSSKSGLSNVAEKIRTSGLRGMGGAGFEAYLKWKSLAPGAGTETYLLVNAHEGEPGTFKDRRILELEPHSMLEGAIIASVVNDIDRIVIGIKSEYNTARWSLEKAVEELEATFGRDRIWKLVPDIEIVSIGGSYVTGEETALMEAIEGNRSEARLRPPFPTVRGLFGRPTLVHNVETLSMIPGIVKSDDNNQEKRYCLTGDVASPGIMKAKLGINAKEMLKIRGGTGSDSIRAFMPGGLSGGILPSSMLDLNLDSNSVKKAGAGLGTGAFIALSNERCMVDVARSVSRFFENESCGKCAPCRLGTRAITETLKRVSSGKAGPSELEEAEITAGIMMQGSICALGQAAGKMFLDSVKYFGGDYEEHLAGNCSRGICKMGDGE